MNNIHSDDNFSCTLKKSKLIIDIDASDFDKKKLNLRTSSPRIVTNEPALIKDDQSQIEHNTDLYVEEMKRGTSNILVSLSLLLIPISPRLQSDSDPCGSKNWNRTSLKLFAF